MDKTSILQTLAISSVTGLIGLALFYGSVHAGGTSFYAGMFFMPFLYLDYKGLIPIDSIFITVILGLVANFILWLVIIMLTKKIFCVTERNKSNAI